MVKIVSLTSTLADTSEDGVTTVGFGDVVDELLDEDGLADTSTSEETNLSTTGVGGQQVDDLDAGDQHFGRSRLLSEGRGICVDGQPLGSLDGPTLIDGVASDVHDTAQGCWSNRHGDR